ncbi:MAG: hypothetical protein MASP_00841 [Candidatus Methanolliviera sp. GoM_asphalt]|nr:MAG: hypothetical protein MASP_00841 [Candidatus Methanolliviera sp. GoM_asphalt]
MLKVCKKRRDGKVVEVVQRVVFGDPEEVLEILCGDSDGKINTLLHCIETFMY